MKCDSKKLAKRYGAVVLPYRDLPRPHQLAIAHYMSIDGEAWDFVNDNWRNHPFWKKNNPSHKDRDEYDAYIYRVMLRNVSHFVDQYGKVKFGVVEIPTDIMSVEILKNGWPGPLVNTVSLYREWIQKHTTIPNHPKTKRWPVILDSTDQLLQDGWHRFHCYLLRGDKTIPAVYYA
jgi:hypothetical protein